MKFQLSIQHQNQQLVFTVRKAVYFEHTVYQVFSENINLIIYKRDGVWRSNLRDADAELIEKLSVAISEQAGA